MSTHTTTASTGSVEDLSTNDLRQADWPDCHDIAAVRWNDDRTTLIFNLRSGEQCILQVRQPEPPAPERHIDLTIMDRVDAVISERMR